MPYTFALSQWFRAILDEIKYALTKKEEEEMDVNRKEYIRECQKDFLEVNKINRVLIHYIKDKKGRRIGVIVAVKPEGEPEALLGWSLCNMKRDTFNKYIGIMKAIDRVQNGNPMIDDDTPFMPRSVEADMEYFLLRVKRYFKETE